MNHLLLFICLGLLYALLKIFLEKRLAPLDITGDEAQLIESAFAKGCSVYALFSAAGADWNYTSAKVEEDFRKYLKRAEVPHYVRDYLRRTTDTKDRYYHKLLFAGGRPPYL